MLTSNLKRKKISLKTTIISLFLLTTLILSSIFVLQLFFYSKTLSFESMNIKIQGLTQAARESIQNQEMMNGQIIELLKLNSVDDKNTFISILKNNLSLYAIYRGNRQGGVYQVINLDTHPALRSFYGANAQAKWFAMEINESKISKQKITFLDEHLREIKQFIREDNFDSRLRPWFLAAMETSEVIKTLPYKFLNIPTEGITYAQRYNGDEIIAIDVLVNDLKALYEKVLNDNYTDAYLFTGNKEIISARYDENLLREFFDKNLPLDKFYVPNKISLGGAEYIIQVEPLKTQKNEYISLFVPYKEAVKPYRQRVYMILFIFLVCAIFIIPLVFYLSKVIVTPIYKLIIQSQKMQLRKFEEIKPVDTPIMEFSQLSDSISETSRATHSYQILLQNRIAELMEQLISKNKELLNLSITDKLTKTFNRAKLETALDEQLAMAKRYESNFVVMLIDISKMGEINTTCGRKIGDEVLMEVATILKNELRQTDILGRWEGGRFLVICPQIMGEEALELAYKLNQIISNYRFKSFEDKVRINIGMCEYTEDKNIETILQSAENALKQAKKEGEYKAVLVD